jgi:hypothetical protein
MSQSHNNACWQSPNDKWIQCRIYCMEVENWTNKSPIYKAVVGTLFNIK